MLGNLLWNLCVNSRDAMPDGGTITISCDTPFLVGGSCFLTKQPIKQGQLRITISDTGCGINPAMMESMFEPLVSSKHQSGGSGLGLVSVANTLDQCQGQIQVSSKPECGTTFQLYFTLAEKPKKTSPVIKKTPALAKNIDTYHLLVVDDQPMITDMLQRGLPQLGWHVSSTNTPLEAAKIWQDPNNHFDLALVDLVMPECTGMEVFDRIRANDPQAQVVLMSGTTTKNSEQSMLAEGLRAVVAKPLQLRKLNTLLRDVIQHGPSTS